MISNREQTLKLIAAADQGNLDGVIDALENGADIDGKFEGELSTSNYSALHIAAWKGHEYIVRYLLSKKANIDNPSIGNPKFSGTTPVFLAAQEGHHRIVKLLLAHQANFYTWRGNLETPLMATAKGGHSETVKILLENDKFAERFDSSNNSALLYAVHNAVYKKNPECVEMIVNRLLDEHKHDPQKICGYLMTHDTLKVCLMELSAKGANCSRIFKSLFKLVIFLHDYPAFRDKLAEMIPPGKNMRYKKYANDILDYIKSLPVIKRRRCCGVFLASPVMNQWHDKDACPRFKDDIRKILKAANDDLNSVLESTDKIFLKKKLYEAAKNGDVELAAECLAKDISADDVASVLYHLPIYIAVHNGHAAMVDFLIRNKANKFHKPSTWTEVDATISEVAVDSGHVNVLKVLDKHGALPNSDRSLAFRALSSGQIEAAIFCFDRGYFYPVKIENITPTFNVLNLAMYGGYIDFLNYMVDQICTWPLEKAKQFLIEHDLQNCIKRSIVECHDSFMPLMRLIDHLYASGASKQFINQFVPDSSFFATNKKYKRQMLDKARELPLEERKLYLQSLLDPEHFYGKLARKSHGFTKVDEDMLRRVAEMAAEVDKRLAEKKEKKKNLEGRLYAAASAGLIEVMKQDIENGVDPNCSTENTYAHPILVATVNGHLNAVELLLDNGVDINFRIPDYNHKWYHKTPLRVAAEFGQLHIVRYLLSKGADVNFGDRLEESPLMAAAFEGNDSIVNLLLENKADVLHVSSKLNVSALSRAAGNYHANIVKIVADHMIKHCSASQIYQHLCAQPRLTMESWKYYPDETRAELMRLFSYLKNNGYSDEKLTALLPAGVVIPVVEIVPPVIKAAQAEPAAPAPQAVAVVSEPKPELPAPAIPQQSAIELAFSSNHQLNLPAPMLPLTVLELAFTSVNIPINLPPPMQPETPKLLAETSRLFTPVNESSPAPQQKAAKKTPVMLRSS